MLSPIPTMATIQASCFATKVSPAGVMRMEVPIMKKMTNIVNVRTLNAKMNEYTVQTFDSMTSFSDNEKVKAKFIPTLPL